jgi:hypothetical protein
LSQKNWAVGGVYETRLLWTTGISGSLIMGLFVFSI